jgi:hypothetical protein
LAIGLFLNLAQAFQEGGDARKIIHPNAQQREGRDLQHLCQPPHGIKLDDLALFVAIERSAGDAEPGRDLIRLQPGFQAIGAKLLADFIKSHGEGAFALAPATRERPETNRSKARKIQKSIYRALFRRHRSKMRRLPQVREALLQAKIVADRVFASACSRKLS